MYVYRIRFAGKYESIIVNAAFYKPAVDAGRIVVDHVIGKFNRAAACYRVSDDKSAVFRQVSGWNRDDRRTVYHAQLPVISVFCARSLA